MTRISCLELGRLCTFVSGGTPARDDPSFWGGTLPWITSADIVGSAVARARSYINDRALSASAANVVPKGTLLLVTRTGIGKVAVAGEDLSFSQDITALLTDPKRIDTTYLAQYLRTQQAHFERASRGATIKGIAREVVEQLVVPLPPLPEQRRIAEVLDRAETLRAQRRQALAQLDALAEAIFLDMFGDPVSNPKRWPKVELGELGQVQGGLQLSAARGSLPLVVPYLRVANVHRDRLDLTEIKRFHATPAEAERTRLEAGDVLIVEGHGNPDEIGRCALWDGSVPGCSHQNHLIRLRPNRSTALPMFISRFLNSAGGRRGLLSASNTTSGLNTISVSKVRSSPALLPPLAIQQSFTARLAQLSTLSSNHQRSLASLNTLFTSLQHRAFRGEL